MTLVAAAGLATALARVVGAAGAAETPALGDNVDTAFGTLTVTRARTAFVPATQGPPTMARMMGTTGTGQLQVWVRLVNSHNPRGFRYSPDQFRLVDAQGHRAGPDGSTLVAERLPEGAAVDGQLWFDLHGARPGPRAWVLEFRDSGSAAVRVALPSHTGGDGDVPGTSHQHTGHGHEHAGHEHAGHEHEH